MNANDENGKTLALHNLTLKEIEHSIDNLKELLLTKIDALEKITDERFDNNARALELEAKEYARRLDILNGEAERLRCIQATYVPREVYDVQHNKLQDDVRDLREFKSNYLGRQTVITSVIAILISLGVSIIVFYLTRGAK